MLAEYDVVVLNGPPKSKVAQRDSLLARGPCSSILCGAGPRHMPHVHLPGAPFMFGFSGFGHDARTAFSVADKAFLTEWVKPASDWSVALLAPFRGAQRVHELLVLDEFTIPGTPEGVERERVRSEAEAERRAVEAARVAQLQLAAEERALNMLLRQAIRVSFDLRRAREELGRAPELDQRKALNNSDVTEAAAALKKSLEQVMACSADEFAVRATTIQEEAMRRKRPRQA